MNVGPGRVPKVNRHWALMFAAKRRAIDVALLKEAERAIAEEDRAKDAMRVNLARAFGRPPP